ncbi:hypothetical protein K3712_000541 [Escherichia coli]|nr:hypothetical protein [Escherichia coli]
MQTKLSINTEAEFKTACITHGDHFLSMLRYMRTDLENRVFSEQKEIERNKIFHKHQNLSEIIKTIENARLDSAPQINV